MPNFKRTYACPYFTREHEVRGMDAISCSGGMIDTRYATLHQEKCFTDRFCCNAAGWKDCWHAKYFERLYDEEEGHGK